MLLPWLILIPFFSGLICLPLEYFYIKLSRWIALIALIIVLFLTISIWLLINDNHSLIIQTPVGLPEWRYEYSISWIPRFGISFHLALDGISLLMLMITALIGIIAVLCSWKEIDQNIGIFYLNLLFVISGIIGIFIAIDLFLFFCFWEMMLIPMFFIILLWAQKEFQEDTNINTAIKFFIYTQGSGLLMLIAIISLALIHYSHTGVWSFRYDMLLQNNMSYPIEYLLMLCFFITFAVKLPIIPLHGWLIDVHDQAPTAGSLSILLKTAAYGLLRFSLPLFPTTSMDFAPIAKVLGLINIFYGAWMAFNQTDLKRVIAYSSVSHIGFILIAIYTGNNLAFQGALFQMISYSISTAGLFILCGQIYERLHTRNMSNLQKIWRNINYIPAFVLFFSLATMGIPGTGNFIGEFLILVGGYNIAPYITGIATVGIIFTTIYVLMMIQRVYFGSSTIHTHDFQPMTIRECSIVLILIILLIGLFIYPQFIINISYVPLNNIKQWIFNTTSIQSYLCL
ncbi:MAG: NADH-quinone oxidoreductase subunit M [Candidatus Dasytiphilus stammeri]